VVKTLARYAPNIESLILHRQVLTPADIERITGLTRGQHLPGRAGAPAAVLPAPVSAVGEVPHADPRLLAVRRGHASRRRFMGASGRLAALEILRAAAMSWQLAWSGGGAGRRVLVVGGGANGLVAAARLGQAGLRVL
jgi:hypothetical protein